MHYLQPYLEQNFSNPKGIFMCPSAAKIRNLTYGTYGERAGYAMNLVLSNSSDRPGVPKQRINRASRVILFADICQAWPDGGDVAFWEPVQMYDQVLPLDTIADTGPDNDEIWSANGWMRYRHNGGVNVVMVDGHVENLKKGTVTVGNLAADR